jgi:hypothetical protein
MDRPLGEDDRTMIAPLLFPWALVTRLDAGWVQGVAYARPVDHCTVQREAGTAYLHSVT